MSRARHKARGGSTKPVWEAGGGTDAAKEAEEKKHGGKVHHGEGEKPKHHGAKRARGGKVEHEIHGVKKESMKHHHGMHVPGRRRGGGVGADRMPLSSAANVKQIHGETPERGEPSD
jgi:hypothetical protein